MAEDQAQERTEEATPKRKQEAKQRGQVARSKELTTAIVMLVACLSIFFLGEGVLAQVIQLLEDTFTLTRHEIFDVNVMVKKLSAAISMVVMALLPLFLVLVATSLFAGSLIGGFNFSVESLAPKYERIDILKGIKRMVSLRALMELLKALAKFVLIVGLGIILLYVQAQKIYFLDNGKVDAAITMGGEILLWSFFILSLSLIVIAIVDVPFQIFQHNKQIKMTQQELRDELKNTEGNPEVKSKIKQLQRDIAENRMMSEVPKADVVITNPTHYAVALYYDRSGNGAPVVLAKGVDHKAFHIQKVAKANDVQVISIPPLARSIYHTTEINGEIPQGLYVAVAQLLAYVYQLKRFKRRSGTRPKPLGNLPIPNDLKY